MQNAGEKAMALVDGQLAPAEVPELIRELARNASLVAELQSYLALSRSRLAAVYASKSDEAIPALLMDTVRRAPTVAPRPERPSTRPSMPPSSLGQVGSWLRSTCRVPAWSIAAAPAAAAVALLAVYLAAAGAGPGLRTDTGLAAALERIESGKDSALATVRPVLSFQSKTGSWCRQYEIRYPDRKVSQSLACRGVDGRWDVVASTPPGSAGLTPASADRRKTIDDRVTAMMRDGPLSPADEAAAIGRGWR